MTATDEPRREPDAPVRDFVAVDPARRTTVRRATVRVLLLTPDDRVLLFRDSDPNTGGQWWITPGGGIDEGERELEAVVRELAEETGHSFDPQRVLGPLARRRVVHGYSDRIVDQDDVFYAVRTDEFAIDTAGHTEEEQVTMLGHRWWPVADLATTDELVWPLVLADLVASVERPDEWPLALPDVEESSVPVG